jgi:SagB-type dehydrogenase family enzyme
VRVLTKLLWISMPLLLAAGALGWLAWRGRLPSRHALNVGFSLLLLVYVLITAGLGIFWVANQHLPVFDWHYLFGYTMLLVLAVHLAFNLRVVWAFFRRPRPRRSPPAPAAAAAVGRRPVVGAFGVLGVLLAAGAGYVIGLRHGRTELRIDLASGGPLAEGEVRHGSAAASWAVVERFHEFSAHSRSGLLRRAPGADWGDPPPPFKTSAEGQRLALPAPRAAAGTAPDLQMLADLLWHTVGVSQSRGGIDFRTSPSSGALFSTELYVLAHDLAGVAPGAWHCDVPTHALVRQGTAGVDAAALGMAPWPDGTVAAIVASAVFRRSGHKYRDRTYRYVLCDLGHALENLRQTAAACGWRATLLPAFDESRIANTLAIDEALEGVLAVLLLQRAGAAPLPALAPGEWRPAALAADMGGAAGGAAGQAAGEAAGGGPGERSRASALLGITDAIHRATSLRALSVAGWARPAPPAGALAQTLPLSPLPPTALPAQDPLPLIARRRSVRRYANRPLRQDELAAVLTAMAAGGPVLSAAIHIDLIVHAVEGLRPGAWRYHAASHGLERRGTAAEGWRARSRAAALGQDVIGDAAVVFVLSADRAALVADSAGAARGYRHAFIEAGLVGERLYLEAEARRLGVCAVGAFYDDEASALAGVDPGEAWVLHFAGLGPLTD